MPGAPKESVLDRIRRTCRCASASSAAVSIDQEAVEAMVAAIDLEAVAASCTALRVPVQFQDLKSEINFLGALHVLDFGSGYNLHLQSKVQRPARECVQFGLLGMHITGASLEAEGMQQFSLHHVMSCFGVDSHEDADSGIPGVCMSRPGPLSPLTNAWKQALNCTGEVLEELGHASMGEYILSFLRDLAASGQGISAAALVEELAENIPALEDKALTDGHTVWYCRRAQNLVRDLYLRFSTEQPELFAFPDIAGLTSESSAELAAALRRKGVLKLQDEQLKRTIDAQEELAAGSAERALRACSIAAVDELSNRIGRTRAAPWQISMHLLLEARQQPDSSVPAHLTPGANAY